MSDVSSPVSELADTAAASDLAERGESALAAALRRAREEDNGTRSQHHSYNSHSSNPW